MNREFDTTYMGAHVEILTQNLYTSKNSLTPGPCEIIHCFLAGHRPDVEDVLKYYGRNIPQGAFMITKNDRIVLRRLDRADDECYVILGMNFIQLPEICPALYNMNICSKNEING